MGKPIDQLRETLRELENELGSLHSLDGETRQLLETTVREIGAILRKKGGQGDVGGRLDEAIHDADRGRGPLDDDATPASEESVPGSTAAGLTDAIERFESSHPTLTGILGRLVDALGQMGI